MTPSGTIRVLLADDHPIVLDGIRSMIEAEQDMAVAGKALDGCEAVEQFRRCRPDVTILDLQMPRMNGIEAISAIRELDPGARVIVLTTYSGDVQVSRALRAGALGYLLKGSLSTELVAMIRDVARGKRRLPAEVACILAENLSTDWLTDREVEVLRAVARGSANKCIAGVLGISEDTVKGHMKSIFSKLGANDRTHAVTIALKSGFLDG